VARVKKMKGSSTKPLFIASCLGEMHVHGDEVNHLVKVKRRKKKEATWLHFFLLAYSSFFSIFATFFILFYFLFFNFYFFILFFVRFIVFFFW
jgi:hypothetical protein